MTAEQHDRIVDIARRAALLGVDLGDALALHAAELERWGVPLLEVVQVADEEWTWMRRVMAEAGPAPDYEGGVSLAS